MLVRFVMLCRVIAAAAIACATASAVGQDQRNRLEIAVTLDAADSGREFEGVGAVSAGASTRNLIDYPKPQRSEVLDYLFKPRFGAALQHLKVEIGGGGNSTCGSEPTHAMTRDELPHPRARGYEFWLMSEARKRNPRVLLDCLPWCYPRWLSSPFSQDSANWCVAFLDVARRQYGLELDWVAAGQNERGADPKWIVNTLRPTLNARGYGRVRLQAPDNNPDGWKIFDWIKGDPRLDAAVQAVGYHYASNWPPAIDDDSRASPEKVKATGKPLWASEEFSYFGGTWDKALLLARLINKHYIRDRITKNEIWAPVDGMYPQVVALAFAGLPFEGAGLLRANEPWSGHYEVWPAIWTTAHTTQFAHPGWRYMDKACGKIDVKTWKGTYVALRDLVANDWSLIVCTDRATNIHVRAAANLKQGTVHVWRSDANDQFVQMQDVEPVRGAFSLALSENSVYSLTTTTGQHKGAHANPPAARPFPLPYRENFESYREGETPKYFSDQQGTFETAGRPEGGACLRQAAPAEGILWDGAAGKASPYTVFGDHRWRDYTVQADVQIVAGSVAIGGRLAVRHKLGYGLVLDRTGGWKLVYPDRVLASGSIAGFDPGAWHTIRLTFRGQRISGWIDGQRLADMQDKANSQGMAYLTSTYDLNCFDDVVVGTDATDPETKRLTFTAVGKEYHFDTGALRGVLWKEGNGPGIGPHSDLLLGLRSMEDFE
jgi:galactosylceramidase